MIIEGNGKVTPFAWNGISVDEQGNIKGTADEKSFSVMQFAQELAKHVEHGRFMVRHDNDVLVVYPNSIVVLTEAAFLIPVAYTGDRAPFVREQEQIKEKFVKLIESLSSSNQESVIIMTEYNHQDGGLKIHVNGELSIFLAARILAETMASIVQKCDVDQDQRNNIIAVCSAYLAQALQGADDD